jgi:hypothetical protein
MAEVSDPSPVPAEADTRRPDANPEVADSFLATCRQENLQTPPKNLSGVTCFTKDCSAMP